MPSRKSSRNHNDYSLSRRYFDDKQTNISHLFRSGVTTPADMEVTEVREVMEVREDTLIPLFQVDPCTMAPTIPTAQTGELDHRTTTPTGGINIISEQLLIPRSGLVNNYL